MIKRGPTPGNNQPWSINLPMKSYAVKISNGQAQVLDPQTGAIVRVLGTNVVGAQVIGDLIQVTTASGRVQIWNPVTGALQRQL